MLRDWADFQKRPGSPPIVDLSDPAQLDNTSKGPSNASDTKVELTSKPEESLPASPARNTKVERISKQVQSVPSNDTKVERNTKPAQSPPVSSTRSSKAERTSKPDLSKAAKQKSSRKTGGGTSASDAAALSGANAEHGGELGVPSRESEIRETAVFSPIAREAMDAIASPSAANAEYGDVHHAAASVLTKAAKAASSGRTNEAPKKAAKVASPGRTSESETKTAKAASSGRTNEAERPSAKVQEPASPARNTKAERPSKVTLQEPTPLAERKSKGFFASLFGGQDELPPTLEEPVMEEEQRAESQPVVQSLPTVEEAPPRRKPKSELVAQVNNQLVSLAGGRPNRMLTTQRWLWSYGVLFVK